MQISYAYRHLAQRIAPLRNLRKWHFALNAHQRNIGGGASPEFTNHQGALLNRSRNLCKYHMTAPYLADVNVTVLLQM